MPLDQKAIIRQIDDILSKCNQTRQGESAVAYAMTVSAIRRLSPPGSIYAASLKGHEDALSNHRHGYIFMGFDAAVGMLQALRTEYEAGYLQSVVELIHADTFADFLEMAHHLSEQGYKDPAAVVTGSVLESHLHKLCNKHGIDTANSDGSPKKADKLNAELTAGGVYNLLDQKSVTAWLDLRNKAAHGKYSEYTKEQVGLMLENVRNFISRLPA
jgi:hypothetical protein